MNRTKKKLKKKNRKERLYDFCLNRLITTIQCDFIIFRKKKKTPKSQF